MCSIDWELIARYCTILTSVVAVWISIRALNRNTSFASRNIRLTIQQSIFKMVMEKAKDCNAAWDKEPQFEKDSKNSPHFLIATELIIAIDVIEKAINLFGKNDLSVAPERVEYLGLYWKQLSPNVRGWVINVTPVIQNDHNKVFTDQISRIHDCFSAFFEPSGG